MRNTDILNPAPDTYVVVHTDTRLPPPDPNEVLEDDRLEDKKSRFDPNRVDRRPVEQWLVNLSDAVTKLDVVAVNPEYEANLLTLYGSYTEAAAAVSKAGKTVLPSVNLIDGKAKQFDDGLYAALDLAYYRGLKDRLRGHVDLVRSLHDKLDKQSPAAPFLAAGLELAGVQVETANKAAKERWLKEFQGDEVASKAIGFYTWNSDLTACFRFLRFFQHEFGPTELEIPLALARALDGEIALKNDYDKVLAFYARLTDPYLCLAVADLYDLPAADREQFIRKCQDKKVARRTVALFPSSSSREVVLFERLFPLGLPPNADLMRELIRRIRSGEVDLAPRPGSGWYDHQVYALEVLLLPSRSEEVNHLLLTRAYKKRMLEAFQVLITKRRETHVRQHGAADVASQSIPISRQGIRPRLRVEPCPTYYVRTARAYSFLSDFLEATVGKEGLQELHGLTKEGKRSQDLYADLKYMRELFYGLYLVSAEDIGLEPVLLPGEQIDQKWCYALAKNWVIDAVEDPDVAVDTRVAVPIFTDRGRNVTRLWTTLGVRLAKLDAEYARPPRIKPWEGGEWQLPEPFQLGKAHYLIPVEEFAEVELPGIRVLTREELRAICDREKTRENIVKALSQ
jgi:hypothetical protein